MLCALFKDKPLALKLCCFIWCHRAGTGGQGRKEALGWGRLPCRGMWHRGQSTPGEMGTREVWCVCGHVCGEDWQGWGRAWTLRDEVRGGGRIQLTKGLKCYFKKLRYYLNWQWGTVGGFQVTELQVERSLRLEDGEKWERECRKGDQSEMKRAWTKAVVSSSSHAWWRPASVAAAGPSSGGLFWECFAYFLFTSWETFQWSDLRIKFQRYKLRGRVWML